MTGVLSESKIIEGFLTGQNNFVLGGSTWNHAPQTWADTIKWYGYLSKYWCLTPAGSTFRDPTSKISCLEKSEKQNEFAALSNRFDLNWVEDAPAAYYLTEESLELRNARLRAFFDLDTNDRRKALTHFWERAEDTSPLSGAELEILLHLRVNLPPYKSGQGDFTVDPRLLHKFSALSISDKAPASSDTFSPASPVEQGSDNSAYEGEIDEAS